MAMVKVSAVKESLLGESVGIKAGDLIKSLNGISVSNIRDLEKRLNFLSGALLISRATRIPPDSAGAS
jgi:hypothetical protein